MPGSTMSEYILYPIASLLKRRAFTVFYQTRNMYRFGFESKKQNKTKTTIDNSAPVLGEKTFVTLEKRRKLGQVNFCKGFWDC